MDNVGHFANQSNCDSRKLFALVRPTGATKTERANVERAALRSTMQLPVTRTNGLCVLGLKVQPILSFSRHPTEKWFARGSSSFHIPRFSPAKNHGTWSSTPPNHSAAAM